MARQHCQISHYLKVAADYMLKIERLADLVCKTLQDRLNNSVVLPMPFLTRAFLFITRRCVFILLAMVFATTAFLC